MIMIVMTTYIAVIQCCTKLFTKIGKNVIHVKKNLAKIQNSGKLLEELFGL